MMGGSDSRSGQGPAESVLSLARAGARPGSGIKSWRWAERDGEDLRLSKIGDWFVVIMVHDFEPEV